MDKKIVEAIKRFRFSLEALGPRIKAIVVFGSCVTGVAAEHSDIDLAVISDDFQGMDIFRRLELIGSALAKARIMEPIEALGYTQGEYDSREEGTLLTDEIKFKGVRVI